MHPRTNMQCRWDCCPGVIITAVQIVTTTALKALNFVVTVMDYVQCRWPPWSRQLKHLPCFFKISLLSSIFVTTWHLDARWFPLLNKQFNSPRFLLNNALAVDSLPGLNDFFNGDFFSTDVFIQHLSWASTSFLTAFLTKVSSQLSLCSLLTVNCNASGNFSRIIGIKRAPYCAESIPRACKPLTWISKLQLGFP